MTDIDTAAPQDGAGAPNPAPSQSQPEPTIEDVLGQAFDEDFETSDDGEDDQTDPYHRDDEGRFASVNDEGEGEGEGASEDQPADQPAEAAEEQPQEQPATSSNDEIPESLNLSGAAREAWSKAPAELRESVSRRVGELESGLQQFQQQIAPLKPYMDAAERAQRPLPQIMNDFFQLEQSLVRDPAYGFATLAARLEKSGAMTAEQREEIAMQLLDGDTPQPRFDPQVGQLQNQMHQLQRQIAERDAQQQLAMQQAEANSVVEQLRAEVGAERFQALEEQMAGILQSPLVSQDLPPAQRLRAAYQYAERLNPDPQQPQAERARTPRAAGLSPSGAPSSGSSPSERRTAETVEEAVSAAFRDF